MTYVFSMAVTAVLFVFLILLLAAKPSVSKKITVCALAIAGISGLLIYGYGYMYLTKHFVLAVLKALLAVCGSFVGANEYAALAAVPVMQTTWMQIICTFIRICALYTTASAIITSLGTEVLKKLRLYFSRRSAVNIIYGVNEDALVFGRELAKQKQGVVVFVTHTVTAAASVAGCVLLSDTHAVNADKKFLSNISVRKHHRNITLYALDKNATANIRYAEKLLNTLQSIGIPGEKLRLVVLGKEDSAIDHLQQTPSAYGYGFVTAVNEPQMAARLLMLKYPPCHSICFDKNGKAGEDFEAALIGFGQMGQAVLKALVMNGQFEGSAFRVNVFAPDCKQTSGNLAVQCAPLFDAYHITLHNCDARSQQMYTYLREYGTKLKYVVVCTGNASLNQEIAEDFTLFFQRIGCRVPVFSCSRQGVEAYAADGTVSATHMLYTQQLLCHNALDQMAMIVNHRYQQPSGKTALQNWMDCDYFSRQSCRASADFVPAMLFAVGKTHEQAAQGDWKLTDIQLENLSKTEHLRWCAFHYCAGFSPMTQQEFQERSDIYRQQLQQTGTACIRIGKNMVSRTHACLIPWEALDDLSREEAAITGKYTDYKAMDTENVLVIPQLLQAANSLAP